MLCRNVDTADRAAIDITSGFDPDNLLEDSSQVVSLSTDKRRPVLRLLYFSC